MCFQLVDYSNVGCDENKDGVVIFQDIPYGTYTLRTLPDVNGFDYGIADQTITVSRDSYMFFVEVPLKSDVVPTPTAVATSTAKAPAAQPTQATAAPQSTAPTSTGSAVSRLPNTGTSPEAPGAIVLGLTLSATAMIGLAAIGLRKVRA